MRDPLERMVDHNLRERRLVTPGDCLVVGVSGGVDSVVLCHGLAAIAPGWNVRLVIAHVNYRRRGRAADHDEAFVRALAKQLGWPCCVKRRRSNRRLATGDRRQNFQDWARQLRYAFFSHVAERYGARVVAVAHHQGDQCETILFNLIRGSGPAGLCGMPWARSLTQDAGRGTVRLVRPLLGVAKKELLAYAKRHRLAYREDASNRRSKYTRNRIRRTLIPLLRRLNPEAVVHCCRIADRMQELTSALETTVDRAWQQCCVEQGDHAIQINRQTIARFPTAVRREVLRRAYGAIRGDRTGLGHDHLVHMDAIIAGRGATYHLPGRVAFHRNADTIQFLRARGGRVTLGPGEISIEHQVPGT